VRLRGLCHTHVRVFSSVAGVSKKKKKKDGRPYS
jgi:hypothetical protein